MRVLVTGAAGFLGSYICEAYSELDVEVHAVDDHSNNVVSVRSLPVYGAAQCDLVGYLAAHRGTPYDLVVHLAGPVGAVGVISHKGRIATELLRTTRAVVDYCSQAEARLLYVSSSEVYGFSGTYRETDDLRVPAEPNARLEYAVGKIAAEYTVRLSQVPHLVVRPFNLVGARQRADGGFVLPTFVGQALRAEPLTVYGDGSQRRAFTAAQDIAEFLAKLRLSRYEGRVLNLGNPDNLTDINGLAHMVTDQLGGSIRYTTGRREHGEDYAEAEGHTKLPDTTLAAREGWLPRRGLEQIIADCVGELAERTAA